MLGRYGSITLAAILLAESWATVTPPLAHAGARGRGSTHQPLQALPQGIKTTILISNILFLAGKQHSACHKGLTVGRSELCALGIRG